MARPQAIKGMVAVAGVTYRIVRIRSATYAVIRILDDAQVGTFRTVPALDVFPEAIEPAMLLAIARHAMQLARTSWARQHRPAAPPSRPVEQPTDRARRRASSTPPANGA